MIQRKLSRAGCRFRSRHAVCTAFITGLAFSCLAADDKKPDPVPPVPVKVEMVYQLPFFCIAEGLGESGPVVRVGTPQQNKQKFVPGDPCTPPKVPGPKKKSAVKAPTPRYIFVPPGNADDVATQLQPQLSPASPGNATVTAAAAVTGTATATATGTGVVPPTQYSLTATADKRSVIIFCRDRNPVCPTGIATLKKAIDDLARPKYAYFKDYPIDSPKTGKALAKAVTAINGKLSGEVLDTMTLRVESAKPLTAAEVSDFEDRLKKDQAAVVAGTVTDKDVLADLRGTTDVQVVGVDLPYFCQADDLTTAPVLFNKDTCASPSRKVQAANFEAIVQALTTALGKSSKLSLLKDRGTILISCDTKCAGDTLQIAQSTIQAVARPVPLFVYDYTVPRGTSSMAAGALRAAPLTATALTDTLVRIGSDTPIPDNDLAAALERVRQLGFGASEIAPLQRMFYRSAADVVGDLLSTPPPGTSATLGGDAGTAPVTGNSSSGSAPASSAPAETTSPSGAASPASTSSSPGTSITITNTTAAAAPGSAPAPGPPPTGTVGQGMTAVEDSVVFTDTSSSSAVRRRARLLTLLDLPRPEVLMNLWSFQASSPDGKEMSRSLQKARDLVNANNDALQHAIDYGWAYLSRKMKDPTFFNAEFHNYLTQRFVSDTEACEANDPSATGCLTEDQRSRWGLCPKGRYCLGYDGAFDPIRPTLTEILLGMMAAQDTAKVVLTTIGCMEGKFEVYGADCFPNRASLAEGLPASAKTSPGGPADCLGTKRAEFLHKEAGAGDIVSGSVVPETDKEKQTVLSCDVLDRAAVSAQRACGLAVTLPLSCFTIQAAKSFLPDNSFSTFSLQQLNFLAEQNLADLVDNLPAGEAEKYSTSSVGLLRGSVADFLFNYKVAQEYPSEFGTYSLPHSAQELNAQFNPLVVAFNQDVAALSRTLLDEVQNGAPNQNHFFQLWRHNKSYIADGLITVRGIGGIESLVDTDTQSSFDSTQAQTLGAVLSAITGSAGSSTPAASGTTNININPDGSASPPPTGTSCTNGSSAGSPLCAVAGLFRGGTTATAIATALAAITPVQSHSVIGRQLTLDVIPHTLPGASSAELDVRLWAQEDSAPTIYSETGSSSNDYVSRVARHNVATRVRVESVKLFDVSTFTALIQRPRAKLPVVPPFIEIPLIGSLLSVPLPAAKVYHASSAIVSAIIVPTASDLAYGLQFRADRAVFREDKQFSHLDFSLRTLTSQRQLPETDPISGFHKEMVKCLAANKTCGELKFSGLPPER